MQNSQFDNTWGDSDINWWKTWVATKKSNLESSIVAESSEHSDFVQALKLPKMNVRNDCNTLTLLKSLCLKIWWKIDFEISNWQCNLLILLQLLYVKCILGFDLGVMICNSRQSFDF